MQRDYVGMHMDGLVDGRLLGSGTQIPRSSRNRERYLCKLCCELFFIEVGFGQKFDGIFTPVPPCGMMAGWIHVVVLGTQKVEKDLANEIDDGTATCSDFTNDLELASRFLVVCNGSLVSRLIGDETKRLSLKRNPLAYDVSGEKNIARPYREASLESLRRERMRET